MAGLALEFIVWGLAQKAGQGANATSADFQWQTETHEVTDRFILPRPKILTV